MSLEGFPGCDVRAKLDHPVIDADAHVVECDFAHLDFVRQLAGEDVAKRVTAERANHGPTVRGFWWGLPARIPPTARWRSCRGISGRASTSSASTSRIATPRAA
jgi:hypothetical protein